MPRRIQLKEVTLPSSKWTSYKKKLVAFRNDSYGINSREAISVTSLINPEFPHLYQFHPNEPLRCVEDISHLTTLLDVERYLQTVACYYGFSFYSDYTCLYSKTNCYVIFNVINAETAWTSHYRTNNYFLIDPSLRFLRQNSTPYIWDASFYSDSLKSKMTLEEQNVASDAMDFQMTQVIHFPFHNSRGDSGLIRFINFGNTMLGRIELFRFLNETYLPLSHLYERKLSILKQEHLSNSPEVELTAREKEVLTWYASGMPTSRISDRLCISENTVRNHLRNIREKMGTRNINQAIAKAVEANLIII